MSSIITPRYIDLDQSNFFAKRLAEHINPHNQLEALPLIDGMMLGNCYWNAEYKAHTSGGKVVFGWLFLHWKNVCIEALHHAVWQSPDGQVFDVTEHPLGRKEKYSVFLRQDESSVSTDIVPAIPNKFQRLIHKTKDSTAFDQYLDVYRRKQALIREANELYWNAGYRCEHQKKSAGFNVSFSNVAFDANTNAQAHQIRAKIDELNLQNGTLIKRLNKF